MTRSIPEWHGATPDSAIPPRVRARVFEANGGICHVSGRKIAAGELWDCEHVIALINGGENRESNLKPALRGFTSHDLRATNYCDHVLEGEDKGEIARMRGTSEHHVSHYTKHLSTEEFVRSVKKRSNKG